MALLKLHVFSVVELEWAEGDKGFVTIQSQEPENISG